jgi:hypothetical protein
LSILQSFLPTYRTRRPHRVERRPCKCTSRSTVCPSSSATSGFVDEGVDERRWASSVPPRRCAGPRLRGLHTWRDSSQSVVRYADPECAGSHASRLPANMPRPRSPNCVHLGTQKEQNRPPTRWRIRIVAARITQFAPNFPDIIERKLVYPSYTFELMFKATRRRLLSRVAAAERVGPFRPGPRGWIDRPIPVDGLFSSGTSRGGRRDVHPRLQRRAHVISTVPRVNHYQHLLRCRSCTSVRRPRGPRWCGCWSPSRQWPRPLAGDHVHDEQSRARRWHAGRADRQAARRRCTDHNIVDKRRRHGRETLGDSNT